MGYYIYPVVVDVDAVRTSFGCGDTALLNTIVKKKKVAIAENADAFAEKIAHGAPRVEVALAEIITGKPTKTKHGFQYGYALELLCHYLGKPLGAPDYAGLETLEMIGDVMKNNVLFEIKNCLDGEGAPFVAIPKPADFPGMAFCEAEMCSQLAIALKRVDPDDSDIDEDEFNEVKAWFSAAKKAKKGLVFFYY